MAAPRIKIATLIKRLAECRAQPVTIVTRTEPRMRKRDNPFLEAGVIRLAERNGFIGADYQSVVNRQRLREITPTDRRGRVIEFRADKLWNGAGRHVRGNRHLVEHIPTGRLYLVFYPQRTIRDAWQTAEGKPLDPAELKPWLIESSGSQRQETEKQIEWRLIGLDNLVSITMSGRQYVLVPPTCACRSTRTCKPKPSKCGSKS